MGKTNTTTASVPAFEFKGKTANELKAALDGGIVTKAAVIAFLKEREAATGLRAPSKKLLADLTAATPTPATTTKAKATTPKAEPKVETTPAPDLSGVLARIAALEAEVASLKAALAASDEDEDDADMDDEDGDDTDADEDDGDEDEDGEPMTVEEARDAMADMALGALRDACRRAGFEPPKGGKAALVDALVQHGIETGMVAAPVAAPVEVKPEPVKAAPTPVKATKPVKQTPASVAASIDLGDDLF